MPIEMEAATVSVQYATTVDGLQIAYKVLGEGPFDLVIVPGLFANLDRAGESPFLSGYVRRFPRFARTILLDRRGTGLSDREAGSGSPEDRMEDVKAVMRAVGSERAALLGQVDGGAIAALFAATYPERVSALVLVQPIPRFSEAADFPHGSTLDALQQGFDIYEVFWGSGRAIYSLTFDAPDESAALHTLASLERAVGTPRSVRRQLELLKDLDARAALPLVKARTLVMHGRGAGAVRPSAPIVRYTADHIPQARFVETSAGLGTWDPAKQDMECDIIEEFLTGHPPTVAEANRVLATVLFTDIVDSTKRAAALGDERWSAQLDAHDARCAAEVARCRGRIVKHTGDGCFATFDGPARAIRCAHALVVATRGLGLEIRAGLHAGEVVKRGEDVTGLAVHIGARIAALATAGEILVSGTVRDLVVGSGIEFDDRGEHDLKGVEGRWRLLAVRG